MKKFLNAAAAMLLGMAALLGAPSIHAEAAEYTVTDVEAVLYTNENTVILSDADDGSTVVLPAVAADLPVQVTGITSNGYFRISLAEETLYIHGIGLGQASSEGVALAAREKAVYDILVAQKAVFPEGMPWTNANYYDWKGGTYYRGYGCAGFAFALSDAAFGDVTAQVHTDYTNIRTGDILRVNCDTHSVIVLEVREDSVIVAEGNFDSAIHWGREIPKEKLMDPYGYIMTRYE